MPVTTASTKLLEPIFQLLQHFRLDQAQILDLAALTAEELTKPDARFPTAAYAQILQTLTQATNNPRIALNLGEATQPRMLGSIGFLMSSAETLGKAYQALSDYLPILLEGALIQMEQTVDGTVLSLELNDPKLHPVEYLLACITNWPRRLTGHQVPVRLVQLSFPEPENPLPYQQFFAAEVRFDAPRNQVLFANDYLSLSCLDANADMHQLHRAFADSLLSKSAQQSALTAQTRNLIRRQLAEGQGCIRREQVAEALGLSLRTLQRKLGLQETNFQDIYDQTRREVCLQLIQQGQLSFGEIAFQLGFSNQSAFQKAFKRWMGTAPSHYRQQIKPLTVIETSALQADEPHKTAWLEEINHRQRNKRIEQRIQQLSRFTLELLEWAALLGEAFKLQELEQVTQHQVARLAIHLWPAEQRGLIDIGVNATADSVNHELNSNDEQTLCRFCHAEIRRSLYQRLSESEKCQRHHRCGMIMLARIPQTFNLAQITPALLHLNRAYQQTDQKQKTQLRQLNIKAALLAEATQQFSDASRYLSNAYRLLRTEQYKKKHQLLRKRATLHLLAGEVRLADQCMQQLPSNNNPVEQVKAALINTEICLHRDQYPRARLYLQDSLRLISDDALPENENDQLMRLLAQHSQINAFIDASRLPPLTPLRAQKSLLQLQLLEQISVIARQQGQPLLAACAIGQMTMISLQQGRCSLTAYAFVSYAWVASWFCADVRLAQIFSVQGMQLANEFGGLIATTIPLPSNIEPHTNIATHAALIQSSQVQHWFTPLRHTKELLLHIDSLTEKHGHWWVQSESRLLQHQLAVLTSHSLTEQLTLCRQHYQQMMTQQQPHQATRLQTSSLLLMEQLSGQKPLPQQLDYQHGWQGVSSIMTAFLLNQQHLWPDLYAWEARLENDLPGYFCVSEALFCTAMMRLILAQQQQALLPRRRVEVEQIESRFELWATHCPENFATQRLLLQAEKACLLNQDPYPLFERAISCAEQHGVNYHSALCYERYGAFLQTQQQHRLAQFCREKSRDIYAHWGASAKVALLDQLKR
ncbi:AraC family transcriptional regulator ligand-binding domain-containing protein [Amphritea sp. 1_MG-2023]|uniref:AraC family transcriptional regulator n=1 Tax=Amphritea sp. 1_MG-2023 TaxID=3062670 RepID=UPI0026E276BA|nr:AraC family transcriptional regulator ligand-binding domain-containing protein [Amphritea sp. 1_MG-2023]MDO6562035.1 AraC family transcriptional regulator ligand-binding domain-containing protein [Amphritea sp. 1_MG-2023]